MKKSKTDYDSLYKELISQIKSKTVNQILASKESKDGFDDLIFTDGTALELYAIDDDLYWVYEDDPNTVGVKEEE